MTAPTANSNDEPKLKSSTKSSSSSSKNKVRVVARIRPLAKYEIDQGSKPVVSSLLGDGASSSSFQKTTSDTTTTILPPLPIDPEVVQVVSDENSSDKNKRWFELDAVLDGSSTQAEVYWKTGAQQAVSQDLFQGYNCTILAYGQTGAGKTFTMGTASTAAATGGSSSIEDEIGDMDGVIPRVCQDLFRGIKEYCDGNATVELSYLEIYNEEIRDLLTASSDDNTSKNSTTNKKQELRIRETLNGEVYVSGLSSRIVTSSIDIGKNMLEASKRRVVASTKMNAESSRSHALCILTVRGVLEDATKITSKLTLVDLAGSERVKKTGAQGSRRQEGININKGLFVLGQVVSALSEQRPKYQRKPPYRDSKLTRLLQDSLGGNSKTIMIACCSPAGCNVEETMNTLRYATSARNIQTTATKNVIQTISPEEAAKLRRDNQLLQQQVKELQSTVEKMTLELQDDDDDDDNNSFGSNKEEGGGMDDAAQQRIRELEQEVEALRQAAQGGGGGGADAGEQSKEGGDGKAAKATTTTTTTTGDDVPPSPIISPRGNLHRHSGHGGQHSSSSKLKKAASLRSMSAANQAAHAMIELPALKCQLALLEEENKTIPELKEEIESLRYEMEELQVDATSSRQAASQLSKILDQLREYKDSEVEKKKLEYDHLKIEEAWVNFVCQMMDSNREQIQKLRDDFYLVVRVVEQQQQLETQLKELKDDGKRNNNNNNKGGKPSNDSSSTANTGSNPLAQAPKLASQVGQTVGRWWKNRRSTAEEEARKISEALTNPPVKDVNSAWGAGTGGDESSTIMVSISGAGEDRPITTNTTTTEGAEEYDNDINVGDDEEEESEEVTENDDYDDEEDSMNPARQLQQELLEQHIQFFDDKMEEMEQDMTAESETLESMRESLRQQREGLEEEIGVDELQRDSLDHVVDMQQDNQLLEQLTALLIGGGTGGGAAAAAAMAQQKQQEQQQSSIERAGNNDEEVMAAAAAPMEDDGLVPIVEDGGEDIEEEEDNDDGGDDDDVEDDSEGDEDDGEDDGDASGDDKKE